MIVLIFSINKNLKAMEPAKFSIGETVRIADHPDKNKIGKLGKVVNIYYGDGSASIKRIYHIEVIGLFPQWVPEDKLEPLIPKDEVSVPPEDNIDWESRRFDLAKELAKILIKSTVTSGALAKECVEYADAIIRELRDNPKNEQDE